MPARPLHAFPIATVAMTALLALVGDAAAQHQPLALAAQKIELAPMGRATAAAYCLDFAREAPTAGLSLEHVVAGHDAAKVCRGSNCSRTLQQAIDDGLVAVRGTGTYRVTFENMTDAPLEIRLQKVAVLSDVRERVRAPESLPVAHDGISQYKVWSAQGQVSGIITIEILASDQGRYTVLGRDGKHERPVATVREVSDANLGAVIAALATDGSSLAIVAPTFTPGRTRALLADLRIRSAKEGTRAIGLVAVTRDGVAQIARPATGIREATEVSTHELDATVRARFGFETGGATAVPSEAIVQFRTVPRPRWRERIGDAIRRGIASARLALKVHRGLGPPVGASLLGDAARVRDAVADEVAALGFLGDTPTVWVIVGDDATGYLIVRLDVEVTPWAA